MKTSFIKVSAACPIVNVADIEFNLTNIQKCITQAYAEGSKFIVFPELCITAYTCADLFMQHQLIKKSEDAIKSLCEFSENKDILIAVGSPLYFNDCLYNCAYIIFNGKLLGIVPKSYIPNYSEFYEKRWFAEGLGIINKTVNLSFASDIPFGTNLLFTCDNIKFGFEICEDLWVTIPPSSYLSLQGANIIANLSASNELVSKADYRKSLVTSQSARCMCSYLYASSGVFESSTDLVFSGHLLISENGLLLKENNRFQRENEVISSIIDINKLNSERMKNTSFRNTNSICSFEVKEISFQFKDMDFGIFDRNIDKYPFVPSNQFKREVRCAEIFNIQSSALAKRFSYTGLNKAIVGISGGLDSTLALLVIVKTFDKLKIPLKNIITITMPGFGTTDRTYLNAINLCKNLGTDLREINIVDACLLHFKDIGHPVEKHDVTYENVQARERTQILMDLANKEGGLLIGTGDLSELALGWCTYNGDHMSMYSVNCSIPKTLVRYLVKYVADKESSKQVTDILLDILDTPVSPELMPKDKSGKITQKTEDIVGPYVLHDFFLYYFMKQGATPEKILFLAKQAFIGDFEEVVIIKWFDKFIKRFFTQQFKRSALPDGPKVGTISVSPRGDLRMPSDASYNSFL
ncbi:MULTISPECIES: NAD(+) synthase [Clostridium]|uniref:Glutamine-dependent NAD(+) synthetase n=1 Tax=Clostridium frigoriphilum TaxID=443253 RepID=A0ABU7UQ81_9CLOT|nr:NAD(+) synthase [Clostridium sp. DSM 17811]MBU3100257.1 NAD(+) synthase [Clostridium sp. DSM 17811]